MTDYHNLRHLFKSFFNPDWGLGHDESMQMLGRQMQVVEYVDRLKKDFAEAYDDEQFSWLAFFVSLRLDDAYGIHDEKAVRDWVKKYVWPEVFPGEPPRIRDL